MPFDWSGHTPRYQSTVDVRGQSGRRRMVVVVRAVGPAASSATAVGGEREEPYD